MKFGVVQCERFNALQGSYSLVTDREIYDSQITATDSEAILLESHFKTDGGIHVGNVSSDRIRARKRFRLYPTGEPIYLNLVYPKPEKPELRLYLSQRAGFLPEERSVWFLFESKDHELWIGFENEMTWRQKNQEEQGNPIQQRQ